IDNLLLIQNLMVELKDFTLEFEGKLRLGEETNYVKDTFFITDVAYIIHKGHILSCGTPAQVVKEEETRQVFLGKDFEWNG
ncbi:MAG: hypothetical protein NTW95_13290, partial [Candidatus Aminicenantes bacterium]|nr:hypothetical protein [Candidatus Aminicenantes bacterium]